MKLPVRIRATDESILTKLFDSDEGGRKKIALVDEVEIELSDVKKRPGMSNEDIIITIVINIATGLPINLLASWIFTHLTAKGDLPIEIGDDPIVKVSQEEIEETLKTVLDSTTSEKDVESSEGEKGN
jgi:hypothetical protein